MKEREREVFQSGYYVQKCKCRRLFSDRSVVAIVRVEVTTNIEDSDGTLRAAGWWW